MRSQKLRINENQWNFKSNRKIESDLIESRYHHKKRKNTQKIKDLSKIIKIKKVL